MGLGELMRHPVVMIVGPYDAPNSWLRELNVRRAESVIYPLAVEGITAICPHNMNRFLYGTLSEQLWRELILELVHRVAALLCSGKKGVRSEGTKAEIELAADLGIPVFYSVAAVAAWADGWRVRQGD